MEAPQGKTDQDREQDRSPAMEVPKGKTDRDREQDSSPGNNLQNAEKLKPNDKAERGETHRNFGIVYQNSSDFHEAIEYHECHLQTAKEGGDKAGQERAYGNLGNDLKGLDDCHKTIECYECHPQTARELGGKAREGRAYGNLGIAYGSLGDYYKAIENHEHHLKIAKQVGDKAGEGGAYGNLGNAYQMLGNFHKAISYHERHLQIAKEVGDTAGEGRALGNLGNAYHSLGENHKAIEYLMHDLQIARELGDKAGEGRTYGNLGNVYESLSDFHKAIEYHERHLQIAKEVGDKAGEGGAHGNLGNAHQMLGDFRKAIEYHQHDLEIAREVGNKAREGQAYGNLGNAYFSLSDFHKAVEYHKRHLQIARAVGDKAGEGGAYGNLGTAHNSLSDFQKAIAYHERHLQIAREVGDKAGEGGAYGNLGNAYENLNNFNKAIEYHERHLEIAKEVGDKAGEGRAYGNLGISYDNLGDYDKAIEYHKHYLEIARKVGDKAGEGGAYGNLGNAYHSLGNLEKAIEYHERHLQIAREVGNEAGEGTAYGNLGNAYNSLGDFHKAIEYQKRSQQIAIKVGDRAGEGRACGNLGITYGNLNDFHKAIKYHECHLQKAKEVGDKAGERRACGRLGDAYHSLGNFHKEIEYRKRHLQIAEEVGDKAGEGESYANEEDEVPYYTGRKDLADIEDATVDTDDSEKTLIKSDKIGGTSAQSVKRSIVKRPNLESLSGSPLAARRKRIRQSAAPEEEKPLEVEEFSSRSTDQDVRQKEEAARNVDERKTVIKRGKIADESETWNLARAGASITFNLVAITKSLTITCSLWTPAALSPPIGSNELLVSNVIELSHDGPPDLEFMENASGSINVALLHSASNFKGYEVVIKQLVDPEYNEWEDLETRNIWHSSVNPTVPNWMCPSAEASCSKRWFSSFAAVWRLKSFVFPKPTSKTSEFICPLPDYPNVSVAIPWNSLPADTDFSLTLKVQEAPTIYHDLEGMFVGPILHISCSNNVTLSAPAKISLPLALTDGGIEPAELHSSQVKILHFNSREESQEWTDITDHLDMPVVLRGGIVTFHVKTFCRFWPWLLKTAASIPCKYASLLCGGIMKQQAGFLACLCKIRVEDTSRYVLNMFCFPRQLRSEVISDMSSLYFVNMQGEGTSKKPLSSGDETCVSLSNGFEVQGAGNVEKIVLKFHSQHHDHEFLRVSIKDPSDLQVDFLKLLGGEERNNFPIICEVPIIPRSPAQGHATFDPEEESSTYSVKDGKPSDEELQYLSRKLAGKWKTLGRRLGFNEAAIDDFDQANKELAEKAYKMLIAWKQKVGCEATYKVLYDTLCHNLVECKLLAEQYCCNKIVGNASP